MQKPFQSVLVRPQLLIAAIAVTLAALGILWLIGWNQGPLISPTLFLALALFACVIVADLDPIQFAPHLKVSITTVPLFLMAALLTPPLAGLAAASSIFVAELLSRHKRMRLPNEIAIATMRWGLIVLGASTVASLATTAQPLFGFNLIGAAIFMFVCDVLSSAFELKLLSKLPYWQTVKSIGKDAILIEAAQYTLGIMGAVAATREMWFITLLILPVLMVHWAYRNLKETKPNLEKTLHSLMQLYPQSKRKHVLDSEKFLSDLVLVQDNYYEVLQVAPNARPEIITSAYRQLIRLYHPDLNRGVENAARMKIVDDAYAVLSDPVKRDMYDRVFGFNTKSTDEEQIVEPYMTEMIRLLETELGQGCRDNTVAEGLEQRARQWANGLEFESRAVSSCAGSVTAFLHGYARMSQLERIQAILQALARAQGRPVPFFKTLSGRE